MDIQVLASGSSGNSYRVDDGHTPLLLDCGIGYRAIQTKLDYGVRHLKGCLLTHEHGDHAKAVKEVLRANVPVYLSQGTLQALQMEYKHSYMARVIKAQEQFLIGSWKVLPFETEHDAAEPLGFLLASETGEKLLYATDTYFVRYRFRGITHLMLECNYSEEILARNVADGLVPKPLQDRLYSSHFSLRHVKEFLAANHWDHLQEIHLLHLSDGNSDAKAFQREIEQMMGVPVYVAGEQ